MADDAAAALEQLEAEVEALRYTYEEDDVAIAFDGEGGVATLSFVARPRGATADGDDENDEEASVAPRSNHFVEADLEIIADSRCLYPNAPATVRLVGARGLGDERARDLVAALEAEAASLAAHGEPALGLLVEQARDLVTAADSPQGDCVICLEALDPPPAPLARLGCFHALHAACLVRWFRHAQADLASKELALVERVRSTAAAAAVAKETLPPRDELGGRALRSVAPPARRRRRGDEEAEEGNEEDDEEEAPSASVVDPFRLECPSCRAPFSVAHVVAAKRREGDGGGGSGGGGGDDAGAAATRALWRLLAADACAENLAALDLDSKEDDNNTGWMDEKLRDEQKTRADAFERQRSAGGVIDASAAAGTSLEELAERQRRERAEEQQQRERDGQEGEKGQPQAQQGGRGGRGGGGRRGGAGGGGRGGGRGRGGGGGGGRSGGGRGRS